MLYKNDKRVVCIGDVKDVDRLKYAMIDVDHVVHAVATKIVPTAEHNPLVYQKTNTLEHECNRSCKVQ